MNTFATVKTFRPSVIPCRPSGTLAVLLFAVVCAAAACDAGPVDATTYVSHTSAQAPSPAAARGQAAATAVYFGDEYADAQRSLQARPDETIAPSF